MQKFNVSQQFVDGINIVTCEGRFDAHTVPSVKPLIDAATTDGSANVLVNLGGAGFIDSSALATLVSGMKQARQKGGDLVICALQQPVRIIFELTRLDKAFTIAEDQYTGLAAFA